MNIINFLTYGSVFIWIIIPFRQYRQRYFFYFLFLACTDIFTISLRVIFHSGSNFFYAPFSYLALVSLLNSEFIKKHRVILSLAFLFVCALSLNNNIFGISTVQMTGLTLSALDFLIFLILLKGFIINFVKSNHINVFLLVLIFYEIMDTAKFLNYFTGFTNDYLYFNISNSFEILFGLFFIIFKADDRRLLFRIK